MTTPISAEHQLPGTASHNKPDRRAGHLVTAGSKSTDVAPMSTFVASETFLHVASLPALQQVWTAEEHGWLRIRDPSTGDLMQQTQLKTLKAITTMVAADTSYYARIVPVGGDDTSYKFTALLA